MRAPRRNGLIAAGDGMAGWLVFFERASRAAICAMSLVAEQPLGPPAQRAGEGADEGVEHVGAEPPVVRERVAQAPRERADPLADRHLRQHLLHQVRRDVRHPPAEARGTEFAAITTQRAHDVVATPGAGEVHEPVLEQAAAQVGIELPHHELRQAAALLLGPLQEARPVLAHERVEPRLFWPSARVAVPTSGCAHGFCTALR